MGTTAPPRPVDAQPGLERSGRHAVERSAVQGQPVNDGLIQLHTHRVEPLSGRPTSTSHRGRAWNHTAGGLADQASELYKHAKDTGAPEDSVQQFRAPNRRAGTVTTAGPAADENADQLADPVERAGPPPDQNRPPLKPSGDSGPPPKCANHVANRSCRLPRLQADQTRQHNRTGQTQRPPPHAGRTTSRHSTPAEPTTHRPTPADPAHHNRTPGEGADSNPHRQRAPSPTHTGRGRRLRPAPREVADHDRPSTGGVRPRQPPIRPAGA
ncbi:hypothetical protein FHR83_004385 [Actinoplanes campanulatus]|uniref:Uncharacterized protein n=1 Tax=Actinoplanes campanulatus TaxID=113559 RepID=A0A7W5AII9_9ACTN|nr:hypothetical protein [Actinoplanes campanulatus]